MVLVYTHKITPRLTYIFKQFFTRILLTPVSFTSKIDEFVAHDGPKFSYTHKPLGQEFHVWANPLLFQQGIKDVFIEVQEWQGIPCFFEATEESVVPFDIFAASFYLISRYEEYRYHDKTKETVFPAAASLAFQNNFLEKPVIDIWAFRFRELLKERFPDYEFRYKKFEFKPIFEIPIAYLYQHKGFIRNSAAFLYELLTFKFRAVWKRLKVWFAFENDPFDNYNSIITLLKQYKYKSIFFFLVGDYSTYDANISHSNLAYQSLIKSVGDFTKVGLLASYFTANNEKLLKEELIRLNNIIHRPIEVTRQHQNHISLPETYQNLVELGVLEEYTMGYEKRIGFRASTCSPFYFYDIEFEIQTPLKVFNIPVNEKTLHEVLLFNRKNATEKVLQIGSKIKSLNGVFTPVFHNYSLSNDVHFAKSKEVFTTTLNHFKND
jgi:hypothetical protein